MANLNLSQFGEKLFVADADHTFIWDTAASISKRVSRNSWLNSGTLTADAPVTISQTWNNAAVAFTGLKVVGTDTASAAASNLFELWAGGTPALDFAVTKAGVIQAYGTYSGAGANYARLALACDSSGNATISTQALGTGTAGVLAFSPANTERMRITTAGNVGIGTTAPSEKLHVLGGKVLFGDATDTTGTAGNGDLTLRTWRAPQLNMVANTSSGEAFGLNLKSGTQTLAGITLNIGSGEVKIGGFSTGGYFPTFYSNNAERMRIDTAGNVGIGTTSPTSKLHVVGAILTDSTITGAGITNTGNRTLWAGKSALSSPTDGLLLITNNAATDFDRVQLGGTTDTFPAITRDGAGIKFTGAAAGATAWIKVPPVAVSALPLAATAGAGARAFVNDALSPTFGSAVTGGGAVVVPVYSTGSAWNVG